MDKNNQRVANSPGIPDGSTDTAARVMEAIGGIVAKLGVCHENAKTEADAWEFRKIRTELAALLPALEHGLRTPAPASDTVSKFAAKYQAEDEHHKRFKLKWKRAEQVCRKKAQAIRDLHKERRVAEQDWRAAQSKLQSLEMGLMRALTSNLCERHSKQVSEMPFDEFREHMKGSCHWCLLEDTNGDLLWHVKEGDRLRNWLREERDAARAECERLRAELAAIRAAMLEDVARDVDGLLEQAERFRRNLIIEAQSRAHNTEASS